MTMAEKENVRNERARANLKLIEKLEPPYRAEVVRIGERLIFDLPDGERADWFGKLAEWQRNQGRYYPWQ